MLSRQAQAMLSWRDTGDFFTQERTGSDIPLGMTSVAAEGTRWEEDRAEVGEAVGDRGLTAWPGWWPWGRDG